MPATVTVGCACSTPRIPRGYCAQKRMGEQYWQCQKCSQQWRLSVPANLRTSDPRWVRMGKNLARMEAKRVLAEQYVRTREREMEEQARRETLEAGRRALEADARARRYRVGTACTLGQRVAYRVRYGLWRAWAQPTVASALEERRRILRDDGTERERYASHTVNGPYGSDDTRGREMIRTLAKFIVAGTAGVLVMGIGLGALAVSGALPTTPGVVVVEDGTIAPAASDAAPVTLSDAWTNLTRGERRQACANVYTGSVNLSATTGDAVPTSLAFLRLICK